MSTLNGVGSDGFSEDSFSFDNLGDFGDLNDLDGLDLRTYVFSPEIDDSNKRTLLSTKVYQQQNPDLNIQEEALNKKIGFVFQARVEGKPPNFFSNSETAAQLNDRNLEIHDFNEDGELVVETIHRHDFRIVEMDEELYCKFSNIAFIAIAQATSINSLKSAESLEKNEISHSEPHGVSQLIHDFSQRIIENSALTKLSSQARIGKMKMEELVIEEERSASDALKALDKKSERIEYERDVTEGIKEIKKPDGVDFLKKKEIS